MQINMLKPKSGLHDVLTCIYSEILSRVRNMKCIYCVDIGTCKKVIQLH